MLCSFHCYNCYYGPVIGICIHFKERLPEAICCCLQTCNVDVVFVVMYCMYIPAFIVTTADISQLWVYLTLGTHAQMGYGTCPVPVCLFVCYHLIESKELTNFLV